MFPSEFFFNFFLNAEIENIKIVLQSVEHRLESRTQWSENQIGRRN